MLFKIMVLLIGVISFADQDTEEYGYCIGKYPCPLDGESLHHLSKKERDAILKCRLDRHLKCSVPDEETGYVLDPVYEMYKIYGEYL
jgi:hypothetical protein